MILGHDRQIKYLEKVLKNGRFAHAYLFLGPEGIGKFTIAKNMAKFFCCQNFEGLRADDKCSQCGLIEKNFHPQVVILGPESTLVSKKEKRKEIPIGDIRELKRRLIFAPAAEEWRVIIISQADKMSKEAGDAFLKILEEPGSRILFILTGVDRDNFSSTIISRTQVVNFSSLPDKALADFLKKQDRGQEFISEALRLAQGRPGVIIKMLADEQSLAAESKLYKEIRILLKKNDLVGAFDLSERIAGEDVIRQKAVFYLLGAIREHLVLEPQLLSEKSFLALGAVKKIHRIWQIMETTNVNPRLAMDVIFLEALGGLNSYAA